MQRLRTSTSQTIFYRSPPLWSTLFSALGYIKETKSPLLAKIRGKAAFIETGHFTLRRRESVDAHLRPLRWPITRLGQGWRAEVERERRKLRPGTRQQSPRRVAVIYEQRLFSCASSQAETFARACETLAFLALRIHVIFSSPT